MSNSKNYYIRVANGKPVLQSLVYRSKPPANGSWLQLSATSLGDCCAFSAPLLPSPANFLAEAGTVDDDEIDLSWDAVTGADSYKVERSESSTFASGVTTEYSSTSTSFTDAGLDAATEYFYRITAVSTGRDYQNSAYAYASLTTAA